MERKGREIMQGGDGLHRFPRHAKRAGASNSAGSGSSSCADMNSQVNSSADLNSGTAPMQLPGQQYQVPQGVVREQDQYMPIANVIRIMRRILPAHAKISDDAKETIQECVSEYISFITGEANDRCQREQRKTITAEDVLWAMGKLGFDDYVEPLTLFLSRYREMENERTSIIRDPILRRGAADYGALPFPSYMPPPLAPMGDQPGIYDPMMLGGYYRDASGAGGGGSSGSSSQNSMANFDPYSQFK